MARPPRIEVTAGYYHVTSRGNNREKILLDDRDGESFEKCLGAAQERYGLTVLSYCLMPSHYHLVVRLGELGLADAMCLLNGTFARRFNLRHGRRDHVFGRRYWAKLIVREAHLLQSCRYTVLNPVRAGLCTLPEHWRFSAYRASVGLTFPPAFLAVDRLLRLWGPTPLLGRQRFESFVARHLAVPGTVDSRQRGLSRG
jgi:REP element-mobilizing transposase RayT